MPAIVWEPGTIGSAQYATIRLPCDDQIHLAYRLRGTEAWSTQCEGGSVSHTDVEIVSFNPRMSKMWGSGCNFTKAYERLWNQTTCQACV